MHKAYPAPDDRNHATTQVKYQLKSSALPPLLTSSTVLSTPTAQEPYQLGPSMDNNYFSSHTPTIQITSLPVPSCPPPTSTSSPHTKTSSKLSPTRDTSQPSALQITKPASQSANTCNNNNADYNLWNPTTIESMQQNEPSKPSKTISSVDYASPTPIFRFNFGIT